MPEDFPELEIEMVINGKLERRKVFGKISEVETMPDEYIRKPHHWIAKYRIIDSMSEDLRDPTPWCRVQYRNIWTLFQWTNLAHPFRKRETALKFLDCLHD